MMSLLCGVVTQPMLVGVYRRFGTICRSYLQGSSSPRLASQHSEDLQDFSPIRC